MEEVKCRILPGKLIHKLDVNSLKVHTIDVQIINTSQPRKKHKKSFAYAKVENVTFSKKSNNLGSVLSLSSHKVITVNIVRLTS